MIDFKPVGLEDRAAIERYTIPSEVVNCDLAFANMYCWQFLYQSAWAEVDGFLVIRFRIGGGERLGYMQPVGTGDFTPLLPALCADAHAHGERLRLIGLTDEGRELLRRTCPGTFAFESDPALEDYIYNADDLRHLPGRRYQPKRNHLNRFEAEHPDFRYEELTPDRFGDCMQLERIWRMERGGHEPGHETELSDEQRAMQRAFAHFDELGLRGGCIYVGGRMVAFTYGSAVNGHTFDIHVEKADTTCDGAFTAINRLFAERLPECFTRINREEDLGIEGLRRAKRSYHPLYLQHKFTAIRLHPDEQAVRSLWQEAFGDGDDFVDSFLIRHYDHRRMVAEECDGTLCAMAHLIPFRSELGRTTYLFGVATARAFRGRGIASRLLRRAEELCRMRGDDALVLIPDGEGLRDFYARLGYGGDLPVSFSTPDGFDFGTGEPHRDRAMVLPLTGAGRRTVDALHLTAGEVPASDDDLGAEPCDTLCGKSAGR